MRHSIHSGGILALTTVLNVVLLKHWLTVLTPADWIAAGSLLVAAVVSALLATPIKRSKESVLTDVWTLLSYPAGTLEAMVTFFLPWALLVQAESPLDDSPTESVGWILAPHLLLVQTHLLSMVVVKAAACRPTTVEGIHVLAHVVRATSLATWVGRSYHAYRQQQEDVMASLFFANEGLLMLPAVATCLWLLRTYVWLTASSGSNKGEGLVEGFLARMWAEQVDATSG